MRLLSLLLCIGLLATEAGAQVVSPEYTVLGVQLGMSQAEIRQMFGEPDGVEGADEPSGSNIIIWVYKKTETAVFFAKPSDFENELCFPEIYRGREPDKFQVIAVSGPTLALNGETILSLGADKAQIQRVLGPSLGEIHDSPSSMILFWRGFQIHLKDGRLKWIHYGGFVDPQLALCPPSSL